MKKEKSFIFKLTEHELTLLNDKAKSLGISKANLIRLNLLNLLKNEKNNTKRTSPE